MNAGGQLLKLEVVIVPVTRENVDKGEADAVKIADRAGHAAICKSNICMPPRSYEERAQAAVQAATQFLLLAEIYSARANFSKGLQS